MQRRWLLPVALGGGLTGAVVLTSEISGSGPPRGVPPLTTTFSADPPVEDLTVALDEDGSSQAFAARVLRALRAQPAPVVQESWEDVVATFGGVIPLQPSHVEAYAARFVGWPGVTTPDSLRILLGLPRGEVLTFADVLVAEDVVAPFNERLADIGREFAALLEAHRLEAWRRGDYLRLPHGAEPDPGAIVTGIHGLVAAGHGWTVSLGLRREDCPDLMEVVQRAVEERQRRDQELRRVLAR